uniref:Elevenin n=1 Tax=Plautia stali TaxID=106108 RepID=A0A1E1G7S6_PLAST|nr:elevenin [Plautia stali]
MICSERRGVSSVCLCLFLLSLLVALATCQRSRSVNCKKMVFAPICRGVAAKRAGKVFYPNQLQQTYPQRNTNQFMSPEKQLLPYWFYTAKNYQ